MATSSHLLVSSTKDDCSPSTSADCQPSFIIKTVQLGPRSLLKVKPFNLAKIYSTSIAQVGGIRENHVDGVGSVFNTTIVMSPGHQEVMDDEEVSSTMEKQWKQKTNVRRRVANFLLERSARCGIKKYLILKGRESSFLITVAKCRTATGKQAASITGKSALRGRNGVCLNARTITPRRTIVRNTPAKKKTKKKKNKLIFADEVKDENFFYGHAFDVLLALGLVPKQEKKEEITLDLEEDKLVFCCVSNEGDNQNVSFAMHELGKQDKKFKQYRELRNFKDHCHPPDTLAVEVSKLRQEMKIKSKLSLAQPLEILHQTLHGKPHDVIAKLGRLDSIKRDIRKHRQIGFSSVPFDPAELCVPQLYSLNRMHVMDVDCEKSSEIVAASAPDLISVKEIEMKVTTDEDIDGETQIPEVTQAAEIKPVVDVNAEDQKKVEEETNHEPVTNGELNGEVSGLSEVKFDVGVENCVENGEHEENEVQAEVERTAGVSKEEAKEREAAVEVKENGSGVCSEEEDRNSVTSSQSRKRTAIGEVEGEGSSSESDAGGKRVRMEREVEGENDGEDERERLVREYVDDCTESVDDMSRAADKLTREIGALGELLRAKELEWNSILRLRKLKEEMLERLLRKRRLAVIMADGSANPEWQPNEKNRSSKPGGLMMVPIISSSPGHVTSTFTPRNMPSSSLRAPDTSGRLNRLQRPILPKPIPNQSSFIDQNSIIGEGRQGPILDVKSIIADYRSRHPENVPRRGRRMKPLDGGIVRGMLDSQPAVVSSTRISGSPALMSMANMALGSGSHVRSTTQDCTSGPPFSLGQENSSRPSSTDSSRSGHQTEVLPLPAPGLSFKDALVQFAKMSQPPPLPAKPPPPPPPYPEVTLHPVPAPHSPPAQHSSLLHGILTKSAPPAHSHPMTHIPPPPPSHRPTTFSPTLARLLTAPERSTTTSTSHFRPPTSRVSICELLSSSKKSRNEITITPVSAHTAPKAKEDVVLLQDDDEETDSADRLVIDEGRDTTATTNEVPADEVPECQGCRQRSAQFVCAGCGNQWYCSRECQVTAWEEHSEMCSG